MLVVNDTMPQEPDSQIDRLKAVLEIEPQLELAVLIGSRATGRSGPTSDWDIAIQWKRGIPMVEKLGRPETLRWRLATLLDVAEASVDLEEHYWEQTYAA